MAIAENKIVNALNELFVTKGIDAIAYRRKQHKYSSQIIDVLVDSRHWKYYLGIEVKSIDGRKTGSLYFTQHFSKNQIRNISSFLRLSGRRGLLIVELRMGKGSRREIYFIPWKDVESRFGRKNGFRVEEIKRYPKMKISNGKCMLDLELLEEIAKNA
jgi:hypothetical protein